MNTFLLGGLLGSPLILATLAFNGQGQDDMKSRYNNSLDPDPGTDLQEVINAYDSLHRTVARALQDKARSWRESPRATLSAGNGASENDSSSPIEVDASGLLVAACPSGLLAGAPTQGSSPGGKRFGASSDRLQDSSSNKENSDPFQDRSSDEDRDADRTQDASSKQDSFWTSENTQSGETIGLILVCSHSAAGQPTAFDLDQRSKGRTDDAPSTSKDAKEASLRKDAIPSMGALQPGVYAVERSGNSVSLTDEQGRTVLHTSIDTAAHASKKGASSQGMGQTSRDLGGSAPHGSNDWAIVFGAITEQVMTSMSSSEGKTTMR